jgi:hypothetical protein
MKKLEDLTKEQLLEDYNKLADLFVQVTDTLSETSMRLVDVTITKCKLLIEIEKLKEKLNKYENTKS